MTRLRRGTMAAVAGAAAVLVAAPAAPAAYTSPTLIVDAAREQTGVVSPLTITLRQSRTDAPTARVVLYVPRGWGSALVRPAGTQLGTVAAQLTATATAREAVVPATGVVRSASPAAFRERAHACLGSDTPVGSVWVLALTVNGQPFEVPVFVTAVTAAEAAVASAKLTVCLDSPDVPEQDGGAPLGAKLVEAKLSLPAVFTNPGAPGDYRWTSLWTPYVLEPATEETPAAARADEAASVEAQALVRLPTVLTLVAAYDRRARRIVLSGSLAEASRAIAGVRILIAGGRGKTSIPLVRVRTDATGSFLTTLRVRTKGAYSFRATAARGVETVGRAGSACAAATFAGVPCLRTLVASFGLTARAKVSVR